VSYLLQFGTGETVVVSGSGLIGRRPAAEPGEFVDHLVPAYDPSKLMSKTHLEFGITDERFWISDRFSGNGTTMTAPDGTSKRCEPGRRYQLERGTRVDIGDQFFLVG
jgi:predicted component of type VI protein secretion system